MKIVSVAPVGCLETSSERVWKLEFGLHRRPACAVGRLAGRNGGNASNQSTRPSRKVAIHTSGRQVADRGGRVARTTHFSNTLSVLPILCYSRHRLRILAVLP